MTGILVQAMIPKIHRLNSTKNQVMRRGSYFFPFLSCNLIAPCMPSEYGTVIIPKCPSNAVWRLRVCLVWTLIKQRQEKKSLDLAPISTNMFPLIDARTGKLHASNWRSAAKLIGMERHHNMCNGSQELGSNQWLASCVCCLFYSNKGGVSGLRKNKG